MVHESKECGFLSRSAAPRSMLSSNRFGCYVTRTSTEYWRTGQTRCHGRVTVKEEPPNFSGDSVPDQTSIFWFFVATISGSRHWGVLIGSNNALRKISNPVQDHLDPTSQLMHKKPIRQFDEHKLRSGASWEKSPELHDGDTAIVAGDIIYFLLLGLHSSSLVGCSIILLGYWGLLCAYPLLQS